MRELELRVRNLETAVALLIGNAELVDEVDRALAARREDDRDRHKEFGEAMSKATFDAHNVMQNHAQRRAR